MTTVNACGFSFLGLAMASLPVLFPGFFPINALDGSNTSALWLTVMGVFQGAFGSYVLVRNEVIPFALRVMAFRLPSFKAARARVAPAMLLRPLRSSLLNTSSDRDQRLAA